MSETKTLERALAALTVRNPSLDSASVREVIEAGQANTGKGLLDLIKERLDEPSLLAAIAKTLDFKFVDLSAKSLPLQENPEVSAKVDITLLKRYSALPLVANDGTVVIAMANPTDQDAKNYFMSKFPASFTPALASRNLIQGRILQTALNTASKVGTGPNAVPEWVDNALEASLASGASDLHFRRTRDGNMDLRIRVDGVLREFPYPSEFEGKETEVIASVMNRAQQSGVDASNVREPQDGTFSFEAASRNIDVRLAMIPQETGPSLVLRFLDSNSIKKRPEDMGLGPAHIKKLREHTKASQGCVIVVGPTGSGKTTTLYSMLREVNTKERNVLTAENPVEYKLEGIGQTQITENAGDKSLTWDRVLRSMLRCDPDVVLVGEIRDKAVANMAMEAAITGHLVFTTLHAHSAPGAYHRLTQMEIAPYMVADAVSLIVSQRLVRRVCDCHTMREPNAEEREIMNKWGLELPEMVPGKEGCVACQHTGYSGRLAVAELLEPSQKVRTLIARNAPGDEVQAAAFSAGWRPIAYDGMRLVGEGRTTVEELVRALPSPEGDSEITEPELVEPATPTTVAAPAPQIEESPSAFNEAPVASLFSEPPVMHPAPAFSNAPVAVEVETANGYEFSEEI